MQEEYTIKDLERLTGIKAHTLRIWERRYALLKPGRTSTNRRRYDATELKRIINVSILNRSGIKISAIAALSDSEIESKVHDLLSGTSNADTEIGALIVAMLDTDADTIEEIFHKSVMVRGFENSFTELVFPFLTRVGVMWQTGTVDPGYEHFVSAFFRSKLIAALELLSPPDSGSKGKVLLFLPENEWHELPLLFYGYIARHVGYKTLYLGQATPLDSAVIIAERWNPDLVVTGLVTTFTGIDCCEFAGRIKSAFKDRRLLISGLLTNISDEELPPGVSKISSARELRTALSAT